MIMTKKTMNKNLFPPLTSGEGISVIGRLALEAMLVEVSVTPKPGLVDRRNSGAHKDMNFFTFLKSAAGLRNCFDDFAKAGSKSKSPSEMFSVLRKIGLVAEKNMFSATEGINTHKGEIFSLGVLSACAGYLAANNEVLTAEKILSLASVVCAGLCDSDFAETRTKSPELLTKGERVYLEYGIAGIRGEAEAGYPIVREAGLPALKKYLADGLSLNDALAFTLIHIMAVNFDTNIISRHNMRTLGEVCDAARQIIDEGICIRKINMFDKEFIRRNISPSGSADLLAVTYFIHSLTMSNPD